MIKPSHECSWSNACQSQISFHEGRFHCLGTSLPVILNAFHNQPLRWYTLEYGDIYDGKSENLFSVAVDATLSMLSKQPTLIPGGPFTRVSADTHSFEEYALTQEIKDTLGIEEVRDGFGLSSLQTSRTSSSALVRYTLQLHDDCFGSVEPVEPELLERLVHSTLRLHSFYLQQEVDWIPVLASLLAMLEDKELRLTSNPRTKRVLVEQIQRDQSRLGERIRYTAVDEFTIRHGKADRGTSR